MQPELPVQLAEALASPHRLTYAGVVNYPIPKITFVIKKGDRVRHQGLHLTQLLAITLLYPQPSISLADVLATDSKQISQAIFTVLECLNRSGCDPVRL